jgi:hypothetical protein
VGRFYSQYVLVTGTQTLLLQGLVLLGMFWRRLLMQCGGLRDSLRGPSGALRVGSKFCGPKTNVQESMRVFKAECTVIRIKV